MLPTCRAVSSNGASNPQFSRTRIKFGGISMPAPIRHLGVSSSEATNRCTWLSGPASLKKLGCHLEHKNLETGLPGAYSSCKPSQSTSNNDNARLRLPVIGSSAFGSHGVRSTQQECYASKQKSICNIIVSLTEQKKQKQDRDRQGVGYY